MKRNIDRIYSELIAVLLLAFAVLSLLSLYSSAAGAVGGSLYRIYRQFAGSAAVVVPLMLIYYAGRGLFGRRRVTRRHAVGLLLIFLVILVIFGFRVPVDELFLYAKKGEAGGLIGAYLTYALIRAFGRSGGHVVLGTTALVGIILVTELSLRDMAGLIKTAIMALLSWIRTFFEVVFAPLKKEKRTTRRKIVDYGEETASSRVAPVESTKDEEKGEKEEAVKEDFPHEPTQLSLEGLDTYRLPPVKLLKKRVRLKSTRYQKDLSEKADLLEKTLKDFGVDAEVVRVRRGPTITRYEVQPKPGVKVSRISSLADDIALSLAAHSIRIEAPIPGKSVVGIEVPNPAPSTVYLREVIESTAFSSSPSRLTLALGKDITGQPVIGDLAAMPHLLVAGATGSGKSVCINCIIASILFKATPNEVKFIMIDPKVVELSAFNGIPHLAAPVITDPKKATGVLKWVLREMERRYELFAKEGQRDIARYNKKLEREGRKGEKLPLIVVIIDELADLMMVAPNEVEDSICRLAQMARAAGIHLVIGTQRPSVDIITGVIKANIPSRIAFAVSSQTDSRTILDMSGAEKLLGRGDMLFFPVGAPKPIRVQGSYISDKEVSDLVAYTKDQEEPKYQEEILSEPDADQALDDEDELLWEAARLVVSMGQASASALQRRFRIGYSRAGRIIDQLERRGLVGPHEGSKPRKVLVDEEGLQRMMNE